MDHKLVGAVIEHAVDHYEVEGWWDILVECWGDEEIWDVIQSAITEEDAIKLAKDALRPIDEYRQEIINA